MNTSLQSFGQATLVVATKGRSTADMTGQVEEVIKKSNCISGLVHLFIQHTSASLIVCENADPDVREDLERYVEKVFCPDDLDFFKHTAEGPDDMPAHIRSVFTNTSLTVPVVGGHLGLGTWQGIYLWEHRLRPHQRKIVVSIQGTS